MFHIIADLELRFDDLKSALDWANARPEFYPRVPYTAMREEDHETRRICCAPRIRDCVTALKPTGLFRRCLNGNPDAKSYENDDEVYPVLVVQFSNKLDYVSPTKEQVPDAGVTNEKWLLKPARPDKIELKWLDAYSIRIRDDEKDCLTICTGVKFVEDVTGRNHPWLNGRGHPLDCSDMGGDPWPRQEIAKQQLWFDYHFGGQLGYAVPCQPFDGRCEFRPVNPDIEPYKSHMDRLKRVCPLLSRNGNLILDGSIAKYGDTVGNVTLQDGLAWVFVPLNADSPVPFAAMNNVLDGKVLDLTVLNPEWVSVPDKL